MVRRLVHQQDVRTPEEHPGHRDAHLPSARQRADIAVDLLVLEAEPVQHLARLALERVAAQMLVFLLHFAEAGEDAIHVVRLCGIAHRVLQRLELVVEQAGTRPLPAIASSSTDRPDISSTSCRK